MQNTVGPSNLSKLAKTRLRKDIACKLGRSALPVNRRDAHVYWSAHRKDKPLFLRRVKTLSHRDWGGGSVHNSSPRVLHWHWRVANTHTPSERYKSDRFQVRVSSLFMIL